MKVKEVWTDLEFEEMGWHDSRIYSLSLPTEQFLFKLDIDYIFKWVEDGSGGFNFWVSPCDLVFENVFNFKVEIDFRDTHLLYISNIERSNPRLSQNGKMKIWDYLIEADNGNISFSSSGYKQRVRDQPVFSEALDIAESR